MLEQILRDAVVQLERALQQRRLGLFGATAVEQAVAPQWGSGQKEAAGGRIGGRCGGQQADRQRRAQPAPRHIVLQVGIDAAKAVVHLQRQQHQQNLDGGWGKVVQPGKLHGAQRLRRARQPGVDAVHQL